MIVDKDANTLKRKIILKNNVGEFINLIILPQGRILKWLTCKIIGRNSIVYDIETDKVLCLLKFSI